MESAKVIWTKYLAWVSEHPKLAADVESCHRCCCRHAFELEPHILYTQSEYVHKANLGCTYKQTYRP